MLVCDNPTGQRIASGVQTRITIPCGKRGYRLGAVHGVQRGAFTHVWCHVRLVAVARINLAALTDADAKAEGFTSLEAFKRHWRREHGRWDGKREVYDLRFVLWDRPPKKAQTNLLDLLTEEVRR